ncbi:MAG: rod shape-determining protein MreD [Armatimonadetes bacterium]|nr:rod shape-determining protein MreD [Armatimonadota bacterium]
MKVVAPWLALALLFWLAAGVQHGAATRLAVFGANPDFLLVVAFCSSILTRPAASAGLGFLAGVLQGAMAGAHLAHHVISRALTCFFIGYESRLEFGVKVEFAALTVAIGTVVSRVLLAILAPPPEIWPFLRATIGTAIYNGVLAVPTYLLVRRLFKHQVKSRI